MIEDGLLTHQPLESSLVAWRPESNFIHNLILALLATLAAYQATAIVFDVVLGRKPSRKVPVSTIHTQLLCDDSSPLSIAAAIFRRDHFDRLRFRNLPSNATILRDKGPVSKTVILPLLFLLIATPLINLLSVIPTIEYDQIVSFSQGGLDNLAFGFSNRELPVRTSEYGETCRRYHTRFAQSESRASFLRCESVWSHFTASPSLNSSVRIRVLPSGRVAMVVYVLGEPLVAELRVSLEFQTTSGVYRIRPSLPRPAMEQMLSVLSIAANRSCVTTSDGSPYAPGGTPKLFLPRSFTESDVFVGEVSHECYAFQGYGKDGLIKGLKSQILLEDGLQGAFRKIMTVTETEKFEVMNIDRHINDPNRQPTQVWTDGGGLPLLTRRRNHIMPGVFAVVTLVILALRVLAEIIFNNDVYESIDYVLRDKLGTSFEMLRNNDVIRYDLQDDIGEGERYGITYIPSKH